MTNYTGNYLQGDTEIKEGLEIAGTANTSGALLDKNKSTSIMLLGDSITQGYYPCELNQMLKSNGYNKINFSGTQNPYYCSDVNSEGYAGYTTEKCLPKRIIG